MKLTLHPRVRADADLLAWHRGDSLTGMVEAWLTEEIAKAKRAGLDFAELEKEKSRAANARPVDLGKNVFAEATA